MNKLEIFLLIVIGFLLCVAFAAAAPIKLKPQGCGFYATDAGGMAELRDSGVTLDAAQAIYAQKPYHPEIRPHAEVLLLRVYDSKLERVPLMEMLFSECMSNEGWIGRDEEV